MQIARFVDSVCNFCTELASGLRPHRDGRKWLISELYGPFDASGYSVSGSIYMVVPRRFVVAAPSGTVKRCSPSNV
jgi:hypothetical protein